jgi:uncharacterized membrane protein
MKKILLKTILWRLFATTITFSTAYIIDGQFTKALLLVIIDTTIKTIGYYGYEKLWLGCNKKSLNNKSTQTENII